MIKAKTGMPLKIETPLIMQKKIDAYFDKCAEEGKRHTVAGFCRSIGLTLNSLNNYTFKGEEFQKVVEDGKLRLAEEIELDGTTNSKNTILDIFLLKQLGYKDNKNTDVTVTGGASMEEKLKSVSGNKF